MIPRKKQSALDDFAGFRTLPGFPEVSSHLMLVNENEWRDMTVDDVWTAWRERISIDTDNEWQEIVRQCLMMDM